MPEPLTQSAWEAALGAWEQQLAAWREAGAQALDPVRFHFMAALLGRAHSLQGAAARCLHPRLSALWQDYGQRLAQARQQAEATVARLSARYPEAAGHLQALLQAGDFRALEQWESRRAAAAPGGPLADLVAALAGQVSRQAPLSPQGPVAAAPLPPAELKAVRYFRHTWSKLAVEQRLAQALAQGPENAGPLNTHALVLRSLQWMQDTAPAYLYRFMDYADTLLWLEQADGGAVPGRKAS